MTEPSAERVVPAAAKAPGAGWMDRNAQVGRLEENLLEIPGAPSFRALESF